MSGEKISVLGLEAYYGGSHKAFLDGWIKHSRHDWTVLGLPAHHWKRRMRHSAIHFAGRTGELMKDGKKFDALFCSSMLNFAEFTGLAPREIRDTPSVVYFHENQLTYPVQDSVKRDFQCALTNMTSALAASEAWFNSEFNRDSFLDKLPQLLRKMPDFRPFQEVEDIRSKSKIFHQGIAEMPARKTRAPGRPMKIIWACRWEHDKNPEDFFKALDILKAEGVPFRLSVLGEQFRSSPEIFESAKVQFKDHIDKWGFDESREEYIDELLDADVMASTAIHEFFGIGMFEGASAGIFPLMPKRLAYPEIFNDENGENIRQFFYDGTPEGLAAKLSGLAKKISDNKSIWKNILTDGMEVASRYFWPEIAASMDNAIERLAKQ